MKSTSTGGSALGCRVAQHADVELPPLDVLLGQGGVVQLLPDVGHPLHQGHGVVHQRLAADAERGVGAERLDEERHPQIAAGLERLLPGEDREPGIEDVLERQELLGEPLVLAEIELAGAAAGVLEAEQIEQAGDGNVAEDVVAEHLHEIEDQVRLAAGQPGDQPLDVAVDAEDGDPVPQAPERPGHLGNDRLVVLRVFVFAVEIGQDGDLHASSFRFRALARSMPQRASDTGSPP